MPSSCFGTVLPALIRISVIATLGTMAHITIYSDVIFSQDFSGSSSMSAYVDPSQPTSGQWNAISGATLTDGSLRFTRGSSTASFTRSTDFSPVPQAFIYRLDLAVTAPTSKITAAAVFQVGAGFSSAVNGPEANAKVNSRFAINFTDSSGGYTFRNLDTPTDYMTMSFSGKYTLTWVINHSGATISYAAPNGTTQTVGNNEWDLWAWSYPIFDDQPATTATQPLTDLKFAFTQGSGTIGLDNFSIDTIPAVPELPATGLFGGAFLYAVVASRHILLRRNRRSAAALDA